MAERLLRSRDVLNELAISYTTLWRWIKSGEFPKPIQVGTHRRWTRADIDELIEARRAKKPLDNPARHERYCPCNNNLADSPSANLAPGIYPVFPVLFLCAST